MKKILILLSSLLLAGRIFAATNMAVMVDNVTHVLTVPTNFWVQNGITTTGTTTALNATVTNYYAQWLLGSNALSVRIIAATNAHTVVSNEVDVLQTNTASLVQGVAGTNAQTKVLVIETNYVSKWFNGNLVVTGTVTATNFIGNGAGLTGVTSVVTGGINSISESTTASNFTGNLTLSGTGVEYGGTNNIRFYRIEYIEKNIVPVATGYEMFWGMPRDESGTLVKVWGKCDGGYVKFDIVEAESNDTWHTLTTNTIPITAFPAGTWHTSFIDAEVSSGKLYGIRILEVTSTASNLTAGVKIRY